jgi:hypothetical protein
VGETHLLLHAADARIDGHPSVYLIAAEGRVSTGPSARSSVMSDLHPGVLHVVVCRRCEGVLGTAIARDGDGDDRDGSTHTLRVHKDRVSVFVAAFAPPAVPGATRGDALRRYTVCSRLWSELVDRATAHSQYRFTLHATDRVTSAPRHGCVFVDVIPSVMHLLQSSSSPILLLLRCCCCCCCGCCACCHVLLGCRSASCLRVWSWQAPACGHRPSSKARAVEQQLIDIVVHRRQASLPRAGQGRPRAEADV